LDDIRIQKGLIETLNERDQLIKTMADEASAANNKNLELEAKLAAAQSELKLATATTPTEGKSSYDFIESRREIEQLEEAINSKLSEANVSDTIIVELAENRLKRDVAQMELAEQTAQLAIAQNQATTAQLENTDLKERLLKETQAASTALRDLEIISQRVEISFSASQLAGYMSQAIDSFNREANTGDLSVNYIINNMEVTIKASLTKSDTGEMTLAAPALSSGDEALSTIKFNILAVPKEENNK